MVLMIESRLIVLDFLNFYHFTIHCVTVYSVYCLLSLFTIHYSLPHPYIEPLQGKIRLILANGCSRFFSNHPVRLFTHHILSSQGGLKVISTLAS